MRTALAALIVLISGAAWHGVPAAGAAGDAGPSGTAILRGDTNGDGRVDAEDAAVILQFDAGLLVFVRYPEEWDVSGDGAVDVTDAALILQYTAGLIQTLPL